MLKLKEPSVLAQLIQSYSRTADLRRGKRIHAHLISVGNPSTFIANHLLNMYAKCGDIDSAISLFDRMSHRNLVTWTALISGFSQNKRFSEAVQTFSSMHSSGTKPTQFALSSSIQALASLRGLCSGRQLHALSLKLGLDVELFVGSNLADMYSKCGCLVDACRVFEAMPCKDEVSWTAMIDGYAKNGDSERAIVAFKNLLGEGMVIIDQHVLCSVLSAYGGLRACKQGKSVHAFVLKMDFYCKGAIVNALVDMYSKSRDMTSALNVANSHSMGWNVVTCSSLVDGYVEMEQTDEAFMMFIELRRRGIEANEFTFSSLIKASAGQAMVEQGTQLHAKVIKTSFVFNPFVSAALVDMYGKCGLLGSSTQMFEEIECPNAFSWNSVIGVLAQHGRGKEALQVFDRMVLVGIRPDHVTFINLLMACSHSRLLEQGLECFDSMSKVHGVEPKEEHYSCVIDMLGRAGRLEEAKEFISRMPLEPNAFGWCSLLGACRTHKAKELGELAAEKLMKLEPGNSGLHVLLSSIYASEGQWEDAKATRKLMKETGVKKLPGFSWVDVDNKTHVFGAEDWSHPDKKEIHEKLEDLSARIREEGYVPLTEAVPSNVEESEKERLLHHHSERIAVAFALVRSPRTKPIIVKKNLRICVDCHWAMKLISKVEGREIIVRDSARFHHFAHGLCSCGDYW